MEDLNKVLMTKFAASAAVRCDEFTLEVVLLASEEAVLRFVRLFECTQVVRVGNKFAVEFVSAA